MNIKRLFFILIITCSALYGLKDDHAFQIELYLAKSGNIESQYNVGNFYFYGINTKVDKGEAIKWWIMAANNGNLDAQIQLANCFEIGDGVTEDDNEALKWYQLAASKGDPYAQYQIGHFYYSGNVVKQDYKEAVMWFKKSAKQVSLYQTSSQLMLGLLYYSHDIDYDGVRQYSEAVKWFRLASDKGDKKSQFYLAECYDNGKGVVQNYKEALQLYKLSAEQEDLDSISKLIEYYSNGKGTNVNKPEAYFWCLILKALGVYNVEKAKIESVLDSNQIEDIQQRATIWFDAHN